MKPIIFLLLAILPALTYGQQDDTKYQNLNEDGVALHGYDPVSYFNSEEPLEGQESYSTKYNGATYFFASEANRELFLKEPAKYEPAYGGWCAYAIGNGYTADINPKTYKILDGKLLLFYNKLFTNTLPKWNKDEETLYPSAERNWKEKSIDL
jgi:YHS domain-containing protein